MKSTPAQLSYTHNYIAAQNVNHPLTLLLLHGTGGDEFEMIPLGRTLDPAVNILSPRGNVLENGQARFFRRLSEGVFDREDLLKHTRDLAEFIENASAQYGFDLDKVVAAGYSNGANIAASLLLLYPRLLAGAILFRPMIPIKTKVDPDLSQIPILIMAGLGDMTVPKYQPKKLSDIFCNAGANVSLQWQEAGHGLINEDFEKAREWLQQIKARIISS